MPKAAPPTISRATATPSRLEARKPSCRISTRLLTARISEKTPSATAVQRMKVCAETMTPTSSDQTVPAFSPRRKGSTVPRWKMALSIRKIARPSSPVARYEK